MELAGGKCQAANCIHSRQVAYEVTGCCLQLSGVCQGGHRFNWSSSEFHVNKNHAKMFDINLLLASAIVVSGNSFAKVKMLFNFMHLAVISKTTFYTYQHRFISALQWMLFIYKSKYVYITLYITWCLCYHYSQNSLKNTR